MERFRRRSCGGALSKKGPYDFVCDYCGAYYQIGIRDTEAVKDLVEENNPRWMRIHQQMESYFALLNRLHDKRKVMDPKAAKLAHKV